MSGGQSWASQVGGSQTICASGPHVGIPPSAVPGDPSPVLPPQDASATGSAASRPPAPTRPPEEASTEGTPAPRPPAPTRPPEAVLATAPPAPAPAADAPPEPVPPATVDPPVPKPKPESNAAPGWRLPSTRSWPLHENEVQATNAQSVALRVETGITSIAPASCPLAVILIPSRSSWLTLHEVSQALRVRIRRISCNVAPSELHCSRTLTTCNERIDSDDGRFAIENVRAGHDGVFIESA